MVTHIRLGLSNFHPIVQNFFKRIGIDLNLHDIKLFTIIYFEHLKKVTYFITYTGKITIHSNIDKYIFDIEKILDTITIKGKIHDLYFSIEIQLTQT